MPWNIVADMIDRAKELLANQEKRLNRGELGDDAEQAELDAILIQLTDNACAVM